MDLVVPNCVYEPADDSELLRDEAKNYAKKANLILDMGTGSGIIAIACALENPQAKVIGIDISKEAVACAKENAKSNNAKNCEFFVSDLFANKKLQGKKFNLILFNPPYLPTAKNEKIKGKLNLAFDGGKSGRETIDRFLDEFEKYIAPGGILLMVDSSLDGTNKTLEKLKTKGFKTKIIASKSFFFEKLSVIRASQSV